MWCAYMFQAVLFLGCVIDNGVSTKDADAPGFDSGAPLDSPDTDSADVVVEECNGIDDDGDGAVDEDFGDLDGDGVADCIDDSCELTVTPAGSVPVGEDCGGSSGWTPPDDVGDFTVEWALSGPNLLSSPVVANLDDDNGDGRIDGDDIPDILAVEYETGIVYNYSGDGSGLKWTRPLNATPMGILLADVDRDGVVNIVVIGAAGLCATTPEGTTLWCNPAVTYTYNGGPTIGDLDGDGHAEIVAGQLIVNAETGETLASGVCTGGATFPALGDLDGDGEKEILCGAEAYNADGSLRWSRAASQAYNYAALVDINADDVPEVLVTGWGYGISLFDWEGTPIASTGANGSYSAACVADLDGDGLPEFAVPSSHQLEVYKSDLSISWIHPTTDNSGASSCAAFDFDADGAYEVVYADENTLFVFDGSSGEVLFEFTDHSSGTMWEYPVVVDVDHDGSSEVVVFESYYGNTGLIVLGHSENQWPPTGPNWAQYAFDGGNVSDDGEVLADAPTPWRDGGFTHARPPGFLDSSSGTWSLDRAAPDLGISITDACTADCVDGPILVSLSATNRGPIASEALVVLYAVEFDGEHEVAQATLLLAAGERSAAIVLSLGVADTGEYGWRADISRTDGGSDCDPADNSDVWSDVPCP